MKQVGKSLQIGGSLCAVTLAMNPETTDLGFGVLLASALIGITLGLYLINRCEDVRR